MKKLDLESLREVFSDRRSHIAIAKILRVSVATDRSFVRLLVTVFPEQIEYIAKMSWDIVGSDAGVFQLPSVEDMVLVAFADGDSNQCYVIRKLTSKQDTIPLRAAEGDMTLISLAGTNLWVTSNEKIYLTKGTTVPTENLVLGQELKTLLVNLLVELKKLTEKVDDLSTEVSTHSHAGNLGYPTSAPNEAAAFVALATAVEEIGTALNELKASPVEDQKILSDLAFTEKGGT